MINFLGLFHNSVHLRCEEKINLTAGREGGLQNLEVHGLVTLRIASEKFGRIKVAVKNSDNKGAQLQVGFNLLQDFFLHIVNTYHFFSNFVFLKPLFKLSLGKTALCPVVFFNMVVLKF